MRKFLFPMIAAAALALVPAVPGQAKASWLSTWLHGGYAQPVYTYSYTPWWYGSYAVPTYTYSYTPWDWGYGWPHRAYGGYRPWYWGGHHIFPGHWRR